MTESKDFAAVPVKDWQVARSLVEPLYAGQFLKAMFVPTAGSHSILEFMSMKLLIAAVAALLGMGFISRAMAEIYKKIRTNEVFMSVNMVFTAVLLIASIISIVSGTYNPFIYFQF